MPLFDAFKKAFDAGDAQIEAATAQLAKLKIAMLGFASLPPAAPSAPNEAQKSEMLLAREILEHGALLSVKAMEIPAFERYVAQLKIYYSDCASTLPESQRQYPILGLNLLRLLAQNRIAEFHTELELIPTELQHANIYIKYPAQLEQHIMEGSYNKVLSAKSEGVFQKEGMYFMDMLVDTVRARKHGGRAMSTHACTHCPRPLAQNRSLSSHMHKHAQVREEIADCSEKAYASIKAPDLQGLLMFGSAKELSEFAEQRGWAIDGATVTFAKMDDDASAASKLPSTQLIQETLAYAKELERIV